MLALLIIQFKHRILLLFDLSLQVNVKVRSRHQGGPHLSWKDHVHYINLLDNYAVDDELFLEVMEELSGQLGLNISHIDSFLIFNKVSDALLTFLLKKFLKPIGPKVVEEFLDVLLLFLHVVVSVLASSDMKIDAHIQRDHYIVLGGYPLDWALKSDGVLGDHDSDAPEVHAVAKAALKPRLNDTGPLTEVLAQGVHSIGHKDVWGEWAREATATASSVIDDAKKGYSSSRVSLVDGRRTLFST